MQKEKNVYKEKEMQRKQWYMFYFSSPSSALTIQFYKYGGRVSFFLGYHLPVWREAQG